MCSNYIKTRDQKTVQELARREALRKFHTLFDFQFVDCEDDYLDQVLMTFDEFKDALRKKRQLLRHLLPNVYDYERFFTYKGETDFLVISESSLPVFTEYCRSLFKNSFLKMEYLFPKLVLVRNRALANELDELDPRVLHSSSSNLVTSKHLPALEPAQSSSRVGLSRRSPTSWASPARRPRTCGTRGRRRCAARRCASRACSGCWRSTRGSGRTRRPSGGLTRVMDEEEFKRNHFYNSHKLKETNLSNVMLKQLPHLKQSSKLSNAAKVNNDLKQYYKTKEDMRSMKIEVLRMNGKPVQQILNETIGRSF